MSGLTMQQALITLGKIYEDQTIDINTKKEFLTTYLTKIIRFNAKRRTTLRRIQIEKEELTSQSKKHTDKIFNVIKQKTNNADTTKTLAVGMAQLRKNAKALIEEEQSKGRQYQEKFDTLIAEVEAELVFDPKKSEEAETINKQLKEKGEKISDVIKKMDEDYKQKIEGLRTKCEDQDSSMKDRFAAVKEKSQIVDDVKREISQMKEQMVPMKMKTNMIQGKLTEYSGILNTTGESISKYKIETLRIAKKVGRQQDQKAEEARVGQELKGAVIKVFQENQELEQKLAAETEKTNQAKTSANLALAQYQAKKKA